MERYIMFFDWKNQYCEHDYITQNNLQIQHNPYQITNIFHRTRTKNFTVFVWKHKRPWIARAIVRKKNGGINPPEFRLYHKAIVLNSMVLAQKTEIQIKETRKKARYKTSHLLGTLSLTKEARIHKRKDSLFNRWCWGNRTVSYM